MERAKERNVKLNPTKCHFRQNQVSYIGHVLTADGVKPDPKKVQAINEMESPTDKKGLQQFLGMINYVGKFIPNLSSESEPLRKLLEKDQAWIWAEGQEESFQKLKSLISQAPVLAYYDVNKPVIISVDASGTGVGGVVLQDGHPIAYASKAFTSCQKNYAQIEKELAAVVFGCQRFHQYVFGKDFVVESDHKPLQSILKKPLAQTPPRLQRMLLQLQKYALDVQYKKGTEMHIADALSRNHEIVTETHQNENDVLQVSQIDINIDNVPMSHARLLEAKAATESDNILHAVKEYVIDGNWPSSKNDVSGPLKTYWEMQDELTVEQGLLFKNHKLIIPTAMRRLITDKIHQSHQGVEKSKKLARDIFYWPGMNKQIEDLVAKCEICNRYRNQNQKEPMGSPQKPTLPWQKIATD